MHLCVISDFLDKSSQDYFVLRCEVATRTGTPLFSSGIFWTGTVSPRPPALSLARPCLCQTPLEPSFAHLLKGNRTKTSAGFSDRDNPWTAQVENSVSFSSIDTAMAMGSRFRKETWDEFHQTPPNDGVCDSPWGAGHWGVASKGCSAPIQHLGKSPPAQGANGEGWKDSSEPPCRENLKDFSNLNDSKILCFL